jgi:hypothetical protein
MIDDQYLINNDEQKPIEEKKDEPKFKVGDLVQMTAKALSLHKYSRLPAVDYGFVTQVFVSKHFSERYVVQVVWQIHGKTLKIYSDRLKKVRFKKNVSQKN